MSVIIELIEEFNEIRERYIKRLDNEFFQLEVPSIHKRLEEIIQQLYTKSTNTNHYWLFCPFSIYANTLPDRLNDFQKKYPDSRPDDFYSMESKTIEKTLSDDRIVFVSDIIIDDHGDFITKNVYLSRICSHELQKNIFYSQRKKLDHIRKLELFGESSINTPLVDQTENYNVEIFKDYDSFRLFNYLIRHMPHKPTDLSYIYRKLSGYDGVNHIVCNQQEFINYCNSNLGVQISKIKDLESLFTPKRQSQYTSLLRQYQNEQN